MTDIYKPARMQGARPLRISSRTSRRILVTGGAGFLGSQLCDRHIEAGDRVICMDDLSTGRPENIAHLCDNPNFVFSHHDVVEPFDIEGPLDIIYNMACPASPPKYQRNPIQTMMTCVYGGVNVLKLAQKSSAIVLQASTSEIYGDPTISPQSEEYWGNVNSFGGRSCYDEGKRAVEALFHDFHECHGVRVRVARIFNTYGPRMDPDDGRVVSNFICQALTGSDITIYGDGEQTRSFCYVDDMLDGLMALVEAPDDMSKPINIGNPVEFTIAELSALVLELTQSGSRIVHHALPQDDPKQRRPDISLARKALKWNPTISLREGLERTVPYFAAQLHANAPGRMQVG